MAAQVEFSLARVLEATQGRLLGASAAADMLTFSSVSIDSRTISSGSLFFAIAGPRFDGHDFLVAAKQAGALAAVVERGRARKNADALDLPLIEVDDPTLALGAIAAAHRASLENLKVIGVTGSNGKTTTKEMLAAILSAHAGADAVLKTEGNLNNHLGVPLTLLRLTRDHRYAVIEMGMSALGEIRYLTRLSRPDVAIVVNVAGVHLETLGSIEKVAEAKSEIYEGLSKDGIAVMPAVEPLLLAHLAKIPAVRQLRFGAVEQLPDFGFSSVRASTEGTAFALRIKAEGDRIVNVTLPLLGAHNAINATAAAAATYALGVSPEAIVRGLGEVRPAKHRGQLIKAGKRTIIDDCYNASPPSMRAALDALSTVAPRERRVAVLGDMLELGDDSVALHAEIGRYAAERISHLVAIGPRAISLAEAARAVLSDEHVVHVEDPTDAARAVLRHGGDGDVVLVKASRGMQLERVIDAIVAGSEAA